MNETTQKYDLIGDIHGYASKLKTLLEKLGYRKKNGVYQHPERKVIFLGDFIDRGPEIRETLQIVRAMVDSGNALAVMGNHEFNAISYHTPDGKGGYLRQHSPQKMAQHRATLDQLADTHPLEWKGWLEWFAQLPLFLDLPGIRAVHAAWDAEAVKVVGAIKKLEGETLRLMNGHGSLRSHRENLINGFEIAMPVGYANPDKEGVKRDSIRTRWWEKLAGKTYRQAVFPDAPATPDIPIPAEVLKRELTYATTEPPVFFGHYWMPHETLRAPLVPNVAVLDYSVAKGGELTAYRWDGEQVLDAKKYVSA